MRRGTDQATQQVHLDLVFHCPHSSPMFESITSNVLVQVQPAYIEEQSSPDKNRFFFAYEVTIQNQSERALQLMRRHWIITDGLGRTEEVEGEGVVGQQPRLEPGERFQYTSFCPLTTPTGSMQGSYFFRDSQGENVEVKIPIFLLCEPGHFH